MRLSASIALFSCLTPLAGQGPAPELRYAAKKGDHARFRAYASTDQSATGIPNTELTKELRLEVLDVGPKGELRVAFEVVSIMGSVSTIAGKVAIDSSSRLHANDQRTGQMSPPAIHRYVTSLVGKTIHARISADGSTIKIENGKQLAEEARKDTPALVRAMVGNVSEATIAEEIALLIERLPPAQTTVGASWARKELCGQGATTLAVDRTDRLTAVDKDAMAITFEGKLAWAEEPASSTAADPEWKQMHAGARFEVLDASAASGRSEVSRKDGLVIKSESTLVSTVVIMGREITTTTKRKVERVEDQPSSPASRPKQK